MYSENAANEVFVEEDLVFLLHHQQKIHIISKYHFLQV